MKPELFKHEGLFEAEERTGLPLRLAFIGLFTCCDREGRFKWRPRVLKLDVLPFDHCDFDAVLSALCAAGLVIKYEVAGESYGCIPTFLKHQTVNQRESKSELPGPNNVTHVRAHDACTETHVHAHGEGKGREGKGRSSSAREAGSVPATNAHRIIAMDLIDRGKANLSPWERKFLTEICAKTTLSEKMQATLDGISAKIGLDLNAVMTTWAQRLETARKMGQWDPKWGPMPGKLGCFAPDALLQPGDGQGWTEWKAAS